MNIALIAHDAKKELLVQFCIAYCGLISRHEVCATGTTGQAGGRGYRSKDQLLFRRQPKAVASRSPAVLPATRLTC